MAFIENNQDHPFYLCKASLNEAQAQEASGDRTALRGQYETLNDVREKCARIEEIVTTVMNQGETTAAKMAVV